MLAIKFRRQGKKHQASYRVVVAEKRSKLRGRFVDDLGWFDPHSKKFDIKKEKVEHWIKVGAKPTDSVHNLLVKAEIIKAPKISVHSRKPKKLKDKAPAPESKILDQSVGETEVKEDVKPEEVEEKKKPASAPATAGKEEEKVVKEKPEAKAETEVKAKQEEKKETAVAKPSDDEKKESKEGKES
ncbi:MAG: 30S ribosomal protein S16 [Patescibacteria group bacterium]|nr:30S ribosomal protein S16 [Patescibacteria group bacterium]